MEFSSRSTPDRKKKKSQQQQEDPTSSRTVRVASRHSVSSVDHASSPMRSSYSSPRRSFSNEAACRKPSPRRGASAWALSPGRSLDMNTTESTLPQRKSVDFGGRVGISGIGGVMGLFARRKKVDPVEEETVHQLRIVLAQLVQWRYVNARSGAAMARQQFVSERKLFYAWLRLAEMRNAVTAKRVLLLRGRLKVKLLSLLIPQVKILINWEQMARPHVDAVAVLGKVLGVTCLSVPLVQGAQANIVSLHRCLRLSMDIMKDIEAKAKIFYSMAETISLLFLELTKTILLEIDGLQELTHLSQKVTQLQMKETSLRANLIQATKAEDDKLALSKPLALHRYITLKQMPAYISINF